MSGDDDDEVVEVSARKRIAVAVVNLIDDDRSGVPGFWSVQTRILGLE